MNALDQTPILASDAAPGVADILAADKTLWNLMAEECRKGIRRTVEGRPLHKALIKYLSHTKIENLLMCRPRSNQAQQGGLRSDKGHVNAGASLEIHTRKEKR